MYRIMLSFILEGTLLGAGIAMFLWIGGYRFSGLILVGMVACMVLAGFIRLIPVLRIESTLQQLLREAGTDREKLEAVMGRKKRPLVSLGMIAMVAFLCLLGLVVRLIQ